MEFDEKAWVAQQNAIEAEFRKRHAEKVPSIASFLLESSLYTVYRDPVQDRPPVTGLLSGGGGAGREIAPQKKPPTFVERLAAFRGTVDGHCLQCRQETIFRGTPTTATELFHKFLQCSRLDSHFLRFIVRAPDRLVYKIGQEPSLADLAQAQIGQYRKALDADLFSELNRAVGVSAHGVHIGGFVYLRRVFEKLLEEAHALAVNDDGWDEGKYIKVRIVDRISLLRHHLPEFLVENSGLYSILSKGIHELSEQECGAYFPVVRSGIELILDEKVERAKKAAKLKEARDAIAKVQGTIRTPASAEPGPGDEDSGTA